MNLYKTNTIELRKYMAEKDIRTITVLSDRSGVNKNTLSKVLNGKIQPSSLTMEKLIHTLDIPAERAGEIFFNQDLRDE